VRELALSILAGHDQNGLLEAIGVQLADPDPQVQLLGLQHLRRLAAAEGIPLALEALNRPDSQVAVTALSLLTHWGGHDFGTRLADVVPVLDQHTGKSEIPTANLVELEPKLAAAREWWKQHRNEFVYHDVPAVLDANPMEITLPASDFEVADLNGHKVHLSDFRGKTVILNFWTTWCTACVGEMPDLIELQRRHPDDLVVLGISLDGVPDEHGHLADHIHNEGEAQDDEDAHPNRARLRAQVSRVAVQRGLNYRVAMDDTGAVSAKYNGGELPTTLIIDPSGQIRRRFVGPRPVAVLESLVKATHGDFAQVDK